MAATQVSDIKVTTKWQYTVCPLWQRFDNHQFTDLKAALGKEQRWLKILAKFAKQQTIGNIYLAYSKLPSGAQRFVSPQCLNLMRYLLRCTMTRSK